jgi:hypothetical protein
VRRDLGVRSTLFTRALSGRQKQKSISVKNWPGVEFLALTLPIFHESSLLTPGFFSASEEISAPPPDGSSIDDCRLEYTYFMKIGQPKLSEGKSEAPGFRFSASTALEEKRAVRSG